MSDDSGSYVQVEEKGRVLEVRINRPDKKNALNLSMYQALTSAIQLADSTKSVRAVILTGTEGCFTSGNDLSVFTKPMVLEDQNNPIFNFMEALRTCSKPVIAAVDGLAIGIGTTLLLHCDLVVASRSAEFKLPFVSLGLTPEYASSFLLPRLVGHAKASEWLLWGSSITAQEGLDAGLVNRVADAPLLKAREMAQSIVQMPAKAVIATKALLKATINAQVEKVIHKEAELFAKALQGAEFAEAAAAFFEKRKPDFSKL